ENDNNLLDTILNKDSLAELTEQEKNVLWKRRDDCLNYPHSLPKLLQAVNWSNKADILEMYCLLFKWPLIKPMQAMELLSSVYADLEVRKFACKSLEKYMKDEEIEYYLLQLVQALKNEPYCDNSLCRFLLKRAIKNQRIGFILFWSLRSEITKPKYKFKFGLLLEAFCRSLNKAQLKSVIKQIEVVEKLSNLAHEIKSNPSNLTLIRSSFLSDTLLKPENRLNLSNFISPLNRSILLGLLEATKCKILASAKRPLLLSWTNEIKYCEFYDKNFQLIFKKGDDLRQDMLTIQALRLMDILWKNEGLDLKMLIYDCFSTGYKTGFIQVIKNSMTLFKIQMKGGMKSTYQIDTLQLYKWIAAHNTDSGQLDKAIELFTRSCAGFCVATFILGIADRHPDNIMVNRHGQIFHIDFGHFLGHFKKKYGIKRERVPFVLTEDFTRVIAKGSVNSSESAEFKRFKNLCELAYMTIRKYSHLIINLFTMMLSSDMTELQSIEDILFLRKTLAIDEPYDKALEFFRNQFNEAYRRSFTTKIDWMCHALNKKNLI
ncbi:phosphatidylinositol 4-5-bisphosphate 3-kinase catalytic subunit alpha isoform, partial [Brachionus plicatilis]